jgi:ParB family chromosome partitioning protein
MFPSRSRSTTAAQNATPDPAHHTEQNAVQELRELPVDSILPNPSQPRRRFDEDTLQDLAGSIGERGVLQPVLVRPLPDGPHELVAGERRWRAAKIAGLKTIPVLVSRYDDLAALQTALIENMARQDLNPVEEARACATLSQEFGLTHQQIAIRVGRQTNVVSNLIRLLRLSEEILELVERGQLSSSHGLALLSADDLQASGALARAAAAEGWSARTLEARVRKSNVDLLGSLKDRGEQAQSPKQARHLEALNVARAWGDLLGAEVHARPLPRRQMRIEVEFDFASEGLALAERLTASTVR